MSDILPVLRDLRHVIAKYKLSHIYEMNYGVLFYFHEQFFQFNSHSTKKFKSSNRVKLNQTNKGVIINTIAVQLFIIVIKFHFRSQSSTRFLKVLCEISSLVQSGRSRLKTLESGCSSTSSPIKASHFEKIAQFHGRPLLKSLLFQTVHFQLHL